jgi:multiple sugar transport system substrate-binding protein
MTLTRRTALVTTLATPFLARAQSAVEITAQYSIPGLFRGLMENISEEFMKRTPNVKVTWRAPEEGYEEILQRHLRDAVTRTLPDVGFHGLNRQRTLLERDIPIDLRPLMAADPETPSLGWNPALLSLGQVGGRQTGIGFSLSTPIMYYNAELLAAAGRNPNALPATWDEVIRLAAAAHDPARNITGFFYDWGITGNWSFQALVFAHGGSMMDAEETRVTFGDEPGRRAMRLLARMVEEGRMPDIRQATMYSDFFAGRMMSCMHSTSQLGRFNREIGNRFRLVTGRFPTPGPNPRLPAGGNVGMIFTRDAAKQKAAWEFIKFACGPVGGTMMVKHTGYMPASTIPATRDDMLKGFYAENPNHLPAIAQLDVMQAWYAFPGQNAIKITDVINDGMQSVVARRATPDAALDRMVTEVTPLLPRRRA